MNDLDHFQHVNRLSRRHVIAGVLWWLAIAAITLLFFRVTAHAGEPPIPAPKHDPFAGSASVPKPLLTNGMSDMLPPALVVNPTTNTYYINVYWTDSNPPGVVGSWIITVQPELGGVARMISLPVSWGMTNRITQLSPTNRYVLTIQAVPAGPGNASEPSPPLVWRPAIVSGTTLGIEGKAFAGTTWTNLQGMLPLIVDPAGNAMYRMSIVQTNSTDFTRFEHPE